jgi:hypothetical protein
MFQTNDPMWEKQSVIQQKCRIISDTPRGKEIWKSMENKRHQELSNRTLCPNIINKNKCVKGKCPYLHDFDVHYYNQNHNSHAIGKFVQLFFDSVSNFPEPLVRVITDYCRVLTSKLPLLDKLTETPLGVSPLFQCGSCADNNYKRWCPNEYISHSIKWCAFCKATYEQKKEYGDRSVDQCCLLIKKNESKNPIVVEEIIPGQGSPNELIVYKNIKMLAASVCFSCFTSVGLTFHNSTTCKIKFDSSRREHDVIKCGCTDNCPKTRDPLYLKGCQECIKNWLYELTDVKTMYEYVFCPKEKNDILCPFFEEEPFVDIRTALIHCNDFKKNVVRKRFKFVLDHTYLSKLCCPECNQWDKLCRVCQNPAVYHSDISKHNDIRGRVGLCDRKECLNVFGITNPKDILIKCNSGENECICFKKKKLILKQHIMMDDE